MSLVPQLKVDFPGCCYNIGRMETNKKPIANSFVVLREEFDDWAVLFDPDTGKGYAIDPVAVFVWKRLDGKHSLEDIILELNKSCDDVPDDATKHCEAFIDDLLKNGLAGYEVTRA